MFEPPIIACETIFEEDESNARTGEVSHSAQAGSHDGGHDSSVSDLYGDALDSSLLGRIHRRGSARGGQGRPGARTLAERTAPERREYGVAPCEHSGHSGGDPVRRSARDRQGTCGHGRTG